MSSRAVAWERELTAGQAARLHASLLGVPACRVGTLGAEGFDDPLTYGFTVYHRDEREIAALVLPPPTSQPADPWLAFVVLGRPGSELLRALVLGAQS